MLASSTVLNELIAKDIICDTLQMPDKNKWHLNINLEKFQEHDCESILSGWKSQIWASLQVRFEMFCAIFELLSGDFSMWQRSLNRFNGI